VSKLPLDSPPLVTATKGIPSLSFIPLTEAERSEMLKRIGVDSLDELFDDVPPSVRFPPLDLPEPLSELEAQRKMSALAARNGHVGELACFVGAGCYNHYVPAAVPALMYRSEFLTSYTPYQPEMSQGTLQYLFEFQSLVCDLLGLDVANASVYDGSSGTAEAVLMAQRLTRRDRVVLSGELHPEYRETVETYLSSRDFDILTSSVGLRDGQLDAQPAHELVDERTACLVVQQPSFFGRIHDLALAADRAHEAGALLVVAVPESISLGLLRSPGACGADIAVAEGQPLGVPMSFGGPWAGLMATRSEHVRQMPGRIVGATVDQDGRRGFVLTLQAREQHIRREKATSNICTSQALLALGVTVYLSLVGPTGLRAAATQSHRRAVELAERLDQLDGYRVLTPRPFFNEFLLECPRPARDLRARLLERGILGGAEVARDYPDLEQCLLLCCTELTTSEQLEQLVNALKEPSL
jgi:glycine dehydrogenase subunit 1